MADCSHGGVLERGKVRDYGLGAEEMMEAPVVGKGLEGGRSGWKAREAREAGIIMPDGGTMVRIDATR